LVVVEDDGAASEEIGIGDTARWLRGVLASVAGLTVNMSRQPGGGGGSIGWVTVFPYSFFIQCPELGVGIPA
jgi:hypothetical protein